MGHGLKRKTTVVGHGNPDTGSICSAVCYANLKDKLTGEEYVPARTGHMDRRTQFVLDYSGVEEPKLVEGVRTQVKDTEIHKARGVADNVSLKEAWKVMQENNVVTIPSIRPDKTLEGLIMVSDTTEIYMNIYDSSIPSKADTQYSSTIETLETDLLVGGADMYFDRGKVLIAAASPDLMEFCIEPHDPVIPGNRYESQLCTIEMGAVAVIMCKDAGVSMTIKEIAQGRGCAVIAATYDTYVAARLINQSMPISYFMTREHLIIFNGDDCMDEVREVMASKRHHDFPILDREGRYLGMISRRNLLGAKGKQVILVDYSEKSRAVAGIESAEIQEIVNHHRLGTVQTMAPIFFRDQPPGYAITIIYRMYQEAGADIKKKIARLLCSTIMSNTLLFCSPTCTPVDEMTTRSLAAITGLDIEKYAVKMFGAGNSLKDKSDEEIFYQDFKRFTADKAMIDVDRIASLNGGKLEGLKYRMPEFMGKAREGNGLGMVFFTLTNILTESTNLICQGQGAVQLAAEAFHLNLGKATQREEPILNLPGVVSRKKQLIPELTLAEQD